MSARRIPTLEQEQPMRRPAGNPLRFRDNPIAAGEDAVDGPARRSRNMPVPERLDHLPLRQMVSGTGDTALVFAGQGLLDWLSRPDRYQIIGHGTGGQIMAASERSLGEAQGVLRQAYGPLIQFGMPSVHTIVDAGTGTLMVPVVFMRIDAPRRASDPLQQLLAARSATRVEVEVQRERVILRAELDLRKSLGLEQQVTQAAGDTTHILSWLVRYQKACATGPMDPAPATVPAGGATP
jgi:hypothetical protein